MRERLRRDVVKGFGWALLSSTTVRVLQAVTTLVLAKLLAPADFGVFALASVAIVAVTALRDLGFAQVLIYRQGDVRRAANTAFILSLAASGGLALLLLASAPALARALSSTDIEAPIRAMTAAILITGTANVPLALLDRELKFRKRAVPEVAGALAYAVISIFLAAAGLGVWSLVVGWISMAAASAVFTWKVSAWRPTLEFSRGDAGVVVSYGKHLMVASLAVFAFFHIDNIAVGKWLGVTALGFYSLAFTVCNLPATNLSHVVNRVMFPTYSKLQDDPMEMRMVYLRTIKYISLVVFPAAVGIMVLAGPVITVFYGPKWMPAIPLFHILALYGLVRSIGATASAVFMSTGNPGLVRRVSVLQLLVAGPLVYTVAVELGTVGVAVLFTGAYSLGTIYALGKVQRILGIGVLNYLKGVSLPLAAAVTAGVSGWITSLRLCPASWAGIFATGAMLGSVYAASIFLLDRSAYAELAGLLSKSRREGKRVAEVEEQWTAG